MAEFAHCLHCFQSSESSQRSFGSTAVIVRMTIVQNVQKRAFSLQRFYRL